MDDLKNFVIAAHGGLEGCNRLSQVRNTYSPAVKSGR